MNGVYSFYVIALIPSVVGAIMFMFDKKVEWREWLGGTAIAFLTSALLHGIAIYSMTSDIETWSGKITYICHFPKWVEEYEERHSVTDSSGNETVWYTTEHTTHREHWMAYLNLGVRNEEEEISQPTFNEIKANFGGYVEKSGKQSSSHGGTLDSGDNNIYKTPNKTGYVYPVTKTYSFENKVKAAPTVFSYAKVPENVPIYKWPENRNFMVSDRLLGVSGINKREFDLMNSRLGPSRLVNVIMVGFPSSDSMLGQLQEAKWIGGKKNDLVLCYGHQNGKVVWSYVFGWTEQEICKRNLETILLNNSINNDILPKIEAEIKANYIKKNWHKFDYITIEPPTWSYIVLIVVMLISQTIFWLWAHHNEFDKNGRNHKGEGGFRIPKNDFKYLRKTSSRWRF